MTATEPAATHPGATEPGDAVVADDVAASRGSRPSVAVDLALSALSVVVVLTLGRLFVDWSYAPRLVCVVVLAHVVAASARRTRLPTTLAFTASALAGIMVISLLYLGSTTRFGLPTLATFDGLEVALESAFGPFQKLVAPVEASLGFQLTLAIGFWVTATFADAAANRADAPLQAVTPTLAVFLFASVLGRGLQFLGSSIAVGAALAFLWLAVANRRSRQRRWTPSEMADGVGSNTRWGAALIVVSSLAVIAGAPLLSSATTDGVIDLRRLGRGDGPQEVDSPLVGMTSLLGERSNEEQFTVESATDHYWRLTALENFNGDSWSSNTRYADVDSGDDLSSTGAPAPSDAIEEHQFDIAGLRSNWLPVAFAPTAIETADEIRYDPESASVFTAERSRPGQQYSVRSAIVASGAPPRPRPGLRRPSDDYLAIPDDLAAALRPRTQLIVGDLEAPLDQAVRLEQYFRDSDLFRYDPTVDYRGEAVPVLAFLRDGAGFCQQFAGAFAAMARSMGLPARVAVGFTFGDPIRDGEARVVRGRHAHAWPEVFIDQLGWLPFEPTPGRGNPDAETYTGRPREQQPAEAGSGGGAETTTTTVVAPSTSAPAATIPNREDDVSTNGPVSTAPEPTPWWRHPMVIAAAIVLSAMLGLLIRWRWVRRRRSSPRDAEPDVRVATAWRRICHDLEAVGLMTQPSESPLEFAERAAGYGGARVARAADLESDRRYRPGPVADDEARAAEVVAAEVRELVTSSLGRRDRVLFELDLLDRSSSNPEGSADQTGLRVD